MIKSAFRVFLILLLMQTVLTGQTETQTEKLLQFSQYLEQNFVIEHQEAVALMEQIGYPARQEFEDGKIIEVMKLTNGIPQFYITHNLGAAQTTRANRLWPGGTLGLSVTGSGYNELGEWDGGAVRATHQELSGRINQVDGATSQSDHSTHVAGTMIAAGVDASAIGMAYQANLKAYEWTNDNAEMAAAAAGGMEISNHSYGYSRGFTWNSGAGVWQWYGDIFIDTMEDYLFGFYSADASTTDSIAYVAPYYLIVKSAGNDRTDGPGSTESHYYWDGSGWVQSTATRDKDGGVLGYDCIGTVGSAKNILTVGAVHEVSNYFSPTEVVMSSFSSWGPVDDGRIKPDIVAKGVDVYSSLASNNSAYASYNGTSMASPNAAGTLALLQQHYQNTHSGSSMRSATLKALALHTADEAGSDTGPDYKFGWGLLNAKTAAQLITEDNAQNVIDELVLNNGNTYTRNITADGSGPLKVTVVWTDPPGIPPSPALDPSDVMLVNDLDLRITKNGSTWYPWSLDRENPTAAATSSAENNIDNVEQVYIANPEAASYTITVDHDGTLTNGSQAFSLVISGINETGSPPLSCSADLISPADGASSVPVTSSIEWETVIGATSYDVYFGTDSPPTNIINGSTFTTNQIHPDLSGSTTYYVRIHPRNANGVNTSCSTIWSFTTAAISKVSSFPFSENFDGFTGIGTNNDWSNDANADFNWTVNSNGTPSANTGPSGDHTSGSGNYLYTKATWPNYPDKWAVVLTPVFDISSLPNPTLEFWYHMYDGNQLALGQLIVDVYGNGQWHTVFSEYGNQGDQWHLATIDISPYIDYTVMQVRFTVTTTSWANDVAIDDVQIRGEAIRTFVSGDLTPHSFQNTNASLQFTSTNSTNILLEVIQNNSDPGTSGALPSGVFNVSPDRYWDFNLLSGTADGTYSLTLDLAGVAGISDYSTLYLLKREDAASPWSKVGTNAWPGSGSQVTWTGISGGFSQFGIGGGGDNSLPVTLKSFDAALKDQKVILSWMTASEIENAGFILERKLKTEPDWEIIGHYRSNPALEGQGNNAAETVYQFADSNVDAAKIYLYRLSDVSFNGKITTHQSIEVSTENLLMPEKYELKNAYPNPFNPSTLIRYALPEQSNVRIDVFDLMGRQIKNLVNENQNAGWHEILWNGQNELKQNVSSGIYFYKMHTGKYNVTKKVILIR